MTPATTLTPEQQIVLQIFLIRQAEKWQQYQREYPGLLDLASYHIAPDGAWISVEHEIDERQGPNMCGVIRLSPACTHLVTKI